MQKEKKRTFQMSLEHTMCLLSGKEDVLFKSMLPWHHRESIFISFSKEGVNMLYSRSMFLCSLFLKTQPLCLESKSPFPSFYRHLRAAMVVQGLCELGEYLQPSCRAVRWVDFLFYCVQGSCGDQLSGKPSWGSAFRVLFYSAIPAGDRVAGSLQAQKLTDLPTHPLFCNPG